jgi:predicted dehydrogenase
MKPLTIGIVGCGKFAEEHVSEIKKIDGTHIVAVCDQEELMAQQLAERHNIPRQYTSLNAMCDELKPDVIHIVTPPKTHLRLGRAACERGSHIYVEKPFALDYSETLQLIDAATLHGRKVTVGHIYHFDPAALRMRKLVAAGVLGEPVHIDATINYDLEGEYGRAFLSNRKHWIYSLRGGLFQNVISHLVEKVLEFVPNNDPTVQIHSYLLSQKLREKRLDILDELRVILAWEGVTASLTFSCNSMPIGSWLQIFGTRNTMAVDFNTRTVVVQKFLPTMLGRIIMGFNLGWQYHKCTFRNLAAFLRSDFHYMAGMSNLLRSFYSSIRSNSEPPIPYNDILRTARIMDLIFDQLPRRSNSDT